MKSFYGLTSAPRAWWLDVTQKLSLSLDGNPCRLTNVCGVVILITVSLKGVIGIHVDDFLIGLAGGALGEKWMFETKSLYR